MQYMSTECLSGESVQGKGAQPKLWATKHLGVEENRGTVVGASNQMLAPLTSCGSGSLLFGVAEKGPASGNPLPLQERAEMIILSQEVLKNPCIGLKAGPSPWFHPPPQPPCCVLTSVHAPQNHSLVGHSEWSGLLRVLLRSFRSL